MSAQSNAEKMGELGAIVEAGPQSMACWFLTREIRDRERIILDWEERGRDQTSEEAGAYAKKMATEFRDSVRKLSAALEEIQAGENVQLRDTVANMARIVLAVEMGNLAVQGSQPTEDNN